MIDIFGAIFLTSLFAVFVGVLMTADSFGSSGRVRFAVVAAIWFFSVGILAGLGVFLVPGTGTLAVGAAVFMPVGGALVAAAGSAQFRHLVLNIPMPALVAVHAGRILGVFFLLLLSAGRLPWTFSTWQVGGTSVSRPPRCRWPGQLRGTFEGGTHWRSSGT
jgi:hypothetical protein